MTFLYRVFGLTLQTPFPCPDLPHEPAASSPPDLRVTEGQVPRSMEGASVRKPRWEAGPGWFLWRGGLRSGRFLAERGNLVTFERNPGAEEAQLQAHLQSQVLPVLLGQRDLLVLHANAVTTPAGYAVAVSGPSGTGKSTTLATLAERGCRILSDDLTVLQREDQGRILVLPGLPHMHLTEAAAQGLDRDISGFPRYALNRGKAVVPLHPLMASEPAPLKALFLMEAVQGGEVRAQALEGHAKLRAIQDCLYGPLGPQDHGRQFQMLVAVAQSVTVYGIQRPIGRWTPEAIADAVLHG